MESELPTPNFKWLFLGLEVQASWMMIESMHLYESLGMPSVNQARNVAHLCGILGYSIAMPDMH